MFVNRNLTAFGLSVLGVQVNTKICRKCQQELPATSEYFHKHKSGKYGLLSRCRSCTREYGKNHYQKNREKRLYEIKKYQKENREKRLNSMKKYRKENRHKISESNKKYQKNNRRQISQRKLARYHTDINLKLRNNLSARIRNFIRKNGKCTIELIGCSVDKLKHHLEKQFTPGMSWDNYGLHGWHIDHIMPCNSFDLTDPEQQKKCFHYTNLQPLWAIDNLKKGSRVI